MDAALWARRAVQVPNSQYWAKAHLVAALGYSDDKKRCVAAIDDLRQAKPEFSIEFAREHLFYLKRADQLETYIEGLQKAGIS